MPSNAMPSNPMPSNPMPSNPEQPQKLIGLAAACVSAVILVLPSCASSRDDRTPGDVGERPEETDVPVTPLETVPGDDLTTPGGTSD
jgi:hypothetical protein